MEYYEKYVSSDGTIKNVKELDYQYLVNALAKNYRMINECLTQDDFFKYNDNIANLNNELFKRNRSYYEKNIEEIEVL